MICKLQHGTGNVATDCKPMRTPYDTESSSADMSPADLFFNMYSGSLIANKTATAYTNDITKLLSSVMMNGLPILGLDDFVRMSDIANDHIGINGKNHVLGIASYRDKFGNFLEIRRKELRITPRNCWSEAFVQHLNNTAEIFQVIIDHFSLCVSSCSISLK